MDMKLPYIYIYNLNPSGILEQLPYKERFSTYEKLALNKTSCRNCSTDEQKMWLDVYELAQKPNFYLHYPGIKRVKTILNL